jgi:hypothetical protein
VVRQGRPRCPLRGLRRRAAGSSRTSAQRLRAFIERPAGYLGEKTDASTGWVFPVPDETYVHGHDAMMQPRRRGVPGGSTEPRETFQDGYVVNTIIDAAYRSMKSGVWEPGRAHAVVGAR